MSLSPLCEKMSEEIGGCLSSGSSTYQVQSFLGQGALGKVAACMRTGDNKKVAIKIMKKFGDFVRQAEIEESSLRKLRELDPDKCNIVRFYHSFVDREHFCLVFEQLDQSLSDFMRSRNPPHLHLKEIRTIVQQVTNALDYLRIVGVIHADLKLENVMLVNQRTEPYRVKLIDFGMSLASPGVLGICIQTLQYRSPEIILGLPFTEAIDMWSLGCMAATMYLGNYLYPGCTEYDMMRYFVETQSLPPDHMLTWSCKTNEYFNVFQSPKASYWTLKSPEQYESETGILKTVPWIRTLECLDDLLELRAINVESGGDKDAEEADVFMFVSLLKKMLCIDDARRITPRQVMQHGFISMDHIAGLYSQSYHAKSPPPPVDLDLSSQGWKGKWDNEDGSMDETSCPSKRCRQDPHLSPPPAPVDLDLN